MERKMEGNQMESGQKNARSEKQINGEMLKAGVGNSLGQGSVNLAWGGGWN